VRYFERFWGFLKTFTVKWEVFIKFTRLLEDIFKEMEALIRNLRLFQRLPGFLKIFSMKLRLLMEVFFINLGHFVNITRLLKDIFRGVEAF
jgi:hypothetical protein